MTQEQLESVVDVAHDAMKLLSSLAELNRCIVATRVSRDRVQDKFMLTRMELEELVHAHKDALRETLAHLFEEKDRIYHQDFLHEPERKRLREILPLIAAIEYALRGLAAVRIEPSDERIDHHLPLGYAVLCTVVA